MKDENLIFIISQPRSGSTMLQKLISNNDLVATSSEPWLLLPFASFERADLINAKYNQEVAFKGYRDFLDKYNLRSILEAEIKSIILSLYGKAKGENKYFLDKTPRYYEILPQLAKWFPKAKFIVLKRNPFAVLNSMIQTWSGGNINFVTLNKFRRDFLEAPRLINSFVQENSKKRNIIEVFYEEMVEHPEKVISELYDFLDIPFSKQNLNIKDNSKTEGIYGDEVYNISRNKAYISNPVNLSKDQWQECLRNATTRKFFMGYSSFLGQPFLEEFGYQSIHSKDKDSTFSQFIHFDDSRKRTKGFAFRLLRKLKFYD